MSQSNVSARDLIEESNPRIRALIPRWHNVVHSAALADASRSRNRAIS